MTATRADYPLIEPASELRQTWAVTEMVCDNCGHPIVVAHPQQSDPTPDEPCICGAQSWDYRNGPIRDLRTLH